MGLAGTTSFFVNSSINAHLLDFFDLNRTPIPETPEPFLISLFFKSLIVTVWE